MRILQVASKIPYPPDDGGRAAIYQVTRELVEHGVEVHFAAPATSDVSARPFSDLVRVEPLTIDPRTSMFEAARTVFHRRPYPIEKFYTCAAQEQVQRLVDLTSYDAVHVEGLHMARYACELRKSNRPPILLRTFNIESDIVRQYAQRGGNPVARLYARMMVGRMTAYESALLQQFDRVVPISPVDDAGLKALVPHLRTTVIPAGVDTRALHPLSVGIPHAILFFTNYEWLPNQDSLRWYLSEIFPRVRARSAEASTVLAGKRTQDVENIPPDVPVRRLGFVRDLNDLSQHASIAIVPLRMGSGMRVKILDLMALGFAIVATPLAVEGIEVVQGEDVLLAGDAAGLAAHVLTLLADPQFAAALGRNARKRVEGRYAWSAVGDQWIRLYRDLVHGSESPS